MGGSFRALVLLALIASLTLGVGACGGDGDSTATTTGPTQRADEPAAKGASGSQGQAGETGKPSSPGKGSGPEDVNAAPLKVSGGGSEQFRVKGGDNSIQEYGEEDEDGLTAAAEAVHGFYVARAEKDWVTACSHLARSMINQLVRLVERGERDTTDCAAILKALTPSLPAAVRRESTVVDASSLRVEDDRSFLIYRGADRTVYAMPLEDEDGAWKLTLLSPTPLG